MLPPEIQYHEEPTDQVLVTDTWLCFFVEVSTSTKYYNNLKTVQNSTVQSNSTKHRSTLNLAKFQVAVTIKSHFST